jgi:hypothetical protein
VTGRGGAEPATPPAVRRLLALSLLASSPLVGCVEPVGVDPEPTVEPTPPPPIAGTARVEGAVVDEAGEPVVGMSVSLCGAVCNLAETDDAGVFVFEDLLPGTKVLEPTLAPVADGEELADAVLQWSRFFDFVTVAEDGDHVLDGPFVLPAVPTISEPLTGVASLDLGADLSVTVDADAIVDDGPMPTGADAVRLGAVPLPPERWPTRGLDGWTVHAAWALAIWDLEAEDAFAVTAELPEAPDGEVAFLVADYTYGFTEGRFWVEDAVLDGTTLSTPPDGGLDRSTLWLAASR